MNPKLPPNIRPFRAHTLILAFLGLAVFAAPQTYGRSATPPTNRTGAPGHGNCSQCHTTVGNGTASLSFSGTDKYEAEQLYSLTVKIDDPGQKRFGFSMVSRETAINNTSTGTWSAGGADTQTYGSSETHVGHLSAPVVDDTHTFTVNWAAPAAGTGDVTFYLATVAANNNGSNGSGDRTYLVQLTISEMTDPIPATLTNPKFLPGGIMQFVLTGTPGSIYKVEYFDDTLQWQFLEEINLNSGVQLVSDPAAGNNPKRLYRATEEIP